jgi:ribosomal protein L15
MIGATSGPHHAGDGRAAASGLGVCGGHGEAGVSTQSSHTEVQQLKQRRPLQVLYTSAASSIFSYSFGYV